MNYDALNPVADAEPVPLRGLSPRLGSLDGKTLGLFASFKGHWVTILDEIGRQIQQRHPTVKFTRFRYTKDLNAYTQVAEVGKDPDELPKFERWLRGCDAAIIANADAGSCSLYLGYNASIIERLGKPGVLTAQAVYMPTARSGLALRGVPGMRIVDINVPDLSLERDVDQYMRDVASQRIAAALEDIIGALTCPLTPAEAAPQPQPDPIPRIAVSGSLREVQSHFYRQGWSYGAPINPPTPSAVEEMLRGTDLPADHVVARFPPRCGRATVEKIAINAVMAGCLPTHLPLLIAAVEAMVDPRMWIEAYTCSMASWMPMMVVNGPVARQINVNGSTSFMSPYFRANACIGHAVGLMLMNIAGNRPGIEDMGVVGHEGHFGTCFAENEVHSPWEPLHEYYGCPKGSSAVTMFFPNIRTIGFGAKEAGPLLNSICDNVPMMGFDPGCAVILSPSSARVLSDAGLSRRDVVEYIVEYARRPAAEVNVRWMQQNCHTPKDVPLPLDLNRSVRKFFSGLHLPVMVAGHENSWGGALYGGGGDHGGPITRQVTLPRDWDSLVAEYHDDYGI